MEARTILNPTQLHLLRMFDINKGEKRLNEMKDVLCDYYQKQLNKKLNMLWDEGAISEEKLEEIKHAHLRAKK